MAANTQAGAILKLQKDGKKLPAATFAPVVIQGARWFKVISGAFANRTDAESLLVDLRRQKVLDAGRGTVVQVPFAFLIDSVPATAVAGMVATYAERGDPVYALRQEDGSAWLLAGAFANREQASGYAESLRASGVTPVLVYRKGRTF
jgi:cell division septation protein DedD